MERFFYGLFSLYFANIILAQVFFSIFKEINRKVVLLKFPADIKSDFNGYDYCVEIINLVKDLQDEEVIFDFENVSFFEANLTALFGVCLEILISKNNTFKIININNKVETILRKNNFLIELGYDKIIDNYETSMQ